MFGSMAIGEYETDVTTGDKDIGQDQAQGSGSTEAGSQETVAGIGEKVIGDRITNWRH